MTKKVVQKEEQEVSKVQFELVLKKPSHSKSQQKDEQIEVVEDKIVEMPQEEAKEDFLERSAVQNNLFSQKLEVEPQIEPQNEVPDVSVPEVEEIVNKVKLIEISFHDEKEVPEKSQVVM